MDFIVRTVPRLFQSTGNFLSVLYIIISTLYYTNAEV